MKRILLIVLLGLTTAVNSLFAQSTQSLSITGPTTWVSGTSVTLSVFDTYSGYGAGSHGLFYWLMVNTTIAPFVSITGLTYFTFPNNPPTFPILFDIPASDLGFMGEAIDLGATSSPLVPDGSYHVTDITFGLAANAPVGTYTLRTTTAGTRSSVQVTSDFGEVAFPQASFVFTVVPEPSTLALLALATAGAGLIVYRRRNGC